MCFATKAGIVGNCIIYLFFSTVIRCHNQVYLQKKEFEHRFRGLEFITITVNVWDNRTLCENYCCDQYNKKLTGQQAGKKYWLYFLGEKGREERSRCLGDTDRKQQMKDGRQVTTRD